MWYLFMIFSIALNDADTALTSVETSLTNLETSITSLDTSLTNWKTATDNIFSACGATCSASKPDYNSISIDVDTSQVSWGR